MKKVHKTLTLRKRPQGPDKKREKKECPMVGRCAQNLKKSDSKSI